MAKNKENTFKGGKKKTTQSTNSKNSENRQTDTIERRDSLAKKLYSKPFQQLTHQQKATITIAISQQDRKYRS